MKIIKFARVNKNIIRVTYKNFWGKTIERDALRIDSILWYWLDTNEIIYFHTDSLNAFYEMQGVTFYVVNGDYNLK